MKIPNIKNGFLVDVARASREPVTQAMETLIRELFIKGFGTDATEDDIEKFDKLLDEMEDQS